MFKNLNLQNHLNLENMQNMQRYFLNLRCIDVPMYYTIQIFVPNKMLNKQIPRKYAENVSSTTYYNILDLIFTGFPILQRQF